MDYLFLIFLGIIVLFCVTNCSARGFKRSVTRLIFKVVAGIIAFFVAKPVSGFIVSRFHFLDIQKTSILSDLYEGSSTFANAFDSLEQMIVSPAVFIVLFIILCFLVTIPVSIINKKIEKKQHGAGALMGILVGIVSFAIAFAPIASLLTLAQDIVPEEMLIEEFDLTEINERMGWNLDTETILSKRQLGDILSIAGDPMLDSLTKINGTSLTGEIRNVSPLLSFVLGNSEGLNIEALINNSSELGETVKKSSFMTKTIEESITTAISKWKSNEEFFGLNPGSDFITSMIFANIIDQLEEPINIDSILNTVQSIINQF